MAFGNGYGMRFSLLVSSLGINVLALLLPLALLQVYDRILPNQSAGTASVVFSAVALALVLSGFLRAVRARVFSRVSATADYRNWVSVATNLMGKNTDSEKARSLLDAPLKARDAEAGQGMVGLYDVPFALVFLSLIWFLGGPVVLAPLTVIVIAAALLGLARPAEKHAKLTLVSDNAALQSIIARLTLGKSSALRAIGSQIATTGAVLRQRASSVRSVENAAGRQLDLMQTAALATTVLVVGFGAAQVLSGGMTTGGLAACTLLGSRAVSQSIGAFLALGRRADAKAAASAVKDLNTSAGSHSGDCLDVLASLLGDQAVSCGDVLLLEGENRQNEAKALKSLATWLWGQVGNPEGAVLVPAQPSFERGSLMDNLSGFRKQNETDALAVASDLGLDAMIGRLAQGYQTEVSRTDAGGLSSGAVKRAAITQALAGKPKLILMERPAAGLDLDGRARLAEVLKLWGASSVIVMTTSDQTLVKAATQRIAVDSGAVDGEAVE